MINDDAYFFLLLCSCEKGEDDNMGRLGFEGTGALSSAVLKGAYPRLIPGRGELITWNDMCTIYIMRWDKRTVLV